MDASNKQPTVAEKFAAVWEKKNAKAARAGGVSLMALSLAACGGSSSTTTTTDTSTDTSTDTTTDTTPTTPVVTSIAMKAGTSGETVTGTSGADSITAGTSALSSANILDGKDAIDGGAGADSIAISLGADFGGFTTGSMAGVETVNLSTTNSTGRTFDASGVTGVSTYAVDGTNSAVVIKDVLEMVSLELSNQSTGDMDLNWASTSAVVTGTGTDVMNVTLAGVGAANTAAATQASNAKDVDIDIASVETLALTSNAVASSSGAQALSSGANRVDVSGTSDATTITAAGATDLAITAVGTKVTSVDASAMTGAISVDTTGTTATLKSVVGGAGADTLTVNAADLKVDATVTGGAGADTLDLAASADKTLQMTMTGVETIDARDISSGTVTMSLANTTDFTTVSMTNPENATTNMAGTLKLIGDTGATAITTKGAHAGTVNTDTTGKVSLAATAEDKLTTDKTVATLSTAVTAANSTELDLNIGSYLDFTGVVTAGKATTVTFTSGSSAQSDVELVTGKAETLTVTTGGAFTLGSTSTDITSVKVLNLTAGKGVTFAGENMTSVYDLNLSGSGSSSSITLEDIGSSTASEDMDITATGLDGGLTIQDIDSGTGALNIDITGMTGNATLGDGTSHQIDSDGAVTIKASKIIGDVTTGPIVGSSVSVDYSDALGTLTLNDGSNGTEAATADITAKTAATVKSGSLVAATADIAASSDSTALTVTLAGGAGNDLFSVAGATTQTSITITGDLGTGTDKLFVKLADSTASGGQTLNFSGVSAETINVLLDGGDSEAVGITGSTASTVDDTVTLGGGASTSAYTNLTLTNIDNVVVFDDTSDAVSINASAISGQAIAVSGSATGDKLTINGTSNADTIDLSTITDGGNDAVFTIDAGGGADKVTASTFVDTIYHADGDSGAFNIDTGNAKVADTSNFTVYYGLASNDKIDLTAALDTQTDYDSFDTATAGADLSATSEGDHVVQYIGTYDADNNTFTSDTTGDDLLLGFINDDTDTTVDEAIILVGQTNVMDDSEITDGVITIA